MAVVTRWPSRILVSNCSGTASSTGSASSDFAGRTTLISEHLEETMATSSARHCAERYSITPAHPSIVTIGVVPVTWISHDLQLMMSTDATHESTTTDDLLHPSICSVLIFPGICSSEPLHCTRHTAVLTLHSVILRSRLPSKFSMNHLAPCCSILGGFLAAAAGAGADDLAGDFSAAATTDDARRAGFLCVIWSLLTFFSPAVTPRSPLALSSAKSAEAPPPAEGAAPAFGFSSKNPAGGGGGGGGGPGGPPALGAGAAAAPGEK
mmetsp:Transcript_46665/g.97676  ORF Transcript_46665/g.97676 Transcript_46665/m.97676 type:complete len:266 (+) Transcript_46665:130-927(+)